MSHDPLLPTHDGKTLQQVNVTLVISIQFLIIWSTLHIIDGRHITITPCSGLLIGLSAVMYIPMTEDQVKTNS